MQNILRTLWIVVLVQRKGDREWEWVNVRGGKSDGKIFYSYLFSYVAGEKVLVIVISQTEWETSISCK